MRPNLAPARRPRMTVRDVLAGAWRRVERNARVTLLRESRRVALLRSANGEEAPRAWIQDAEEAALRVLDGSFIAALRANDVPSNFRGAGGNASSPLATPPALVTADAADAAAEGVAIEFNFKSSHARALLVAVCSFYGVATAIGGRAARAPSATADADADAAIGAAADATPAATPAAARASPPSKPSRRDRRAATLAHLRGGEQHASCRIYLKAAPSAEAALSREAIAAVRRALSDAWVSANGGASADAGGDGAPIVPLISVHVRTLAEEGAEAQPRARPKFSYGRTSAAAAAKARESDDCNDDAQ